MQKQKQKKNTLVTALRNYNLVVKQHFYFYKNKMKKVKHLLLAWQCSLYLHAFHVHRMDAFLFTNILPNFSSSELHSRLQCTDTWVWPLQTGL